MFTRGLPFRKPEVAMSVSYLFDTYGSLLAFAIAKQEGA